MNKTLSEIMEQEGTYGKKDLLKMASSDSNGNVQRTLPRYLAISRNLVLNEDQAVTQLMIQLRNVDISEAPGCIALYLNAQLQTVQCAMKHLKCQSTGRSAPQESGSEQVSHEKTFIDDMQQHCESKDLTIKQFLHIKQRIYGVQGPIDITTLMADKDFESYKAWYRDSDGEAKEEAIELLLNRDDLYARDKLDQLLLDIDSTDSKLLSYVMQVGGADPKKQASVVERICKAAKGKGVKLELPESVANSFESMQVLRKGGGNAKELVTGHLHRLNIGDAEAMVSVVQLAQDLSNDQGFKTQFNKRSDKTESVVKFLDSVEYSAEGKGRENHIQELSRIKGNGDPKLLAALNYLTVNKDGQVGKGGGFSSGMSATLYSATV